MLELKVLGGASLTRDGERLAGILSGPKRMAFLIYLALGNREQAYERDDLLARFWPEADEARGRAAFRQLLHVVRRDLGPGIIESEGSRLRLVPGAVQCDAVLLEEWTADGRWGEALELYKGELLAGFHLPGVPDFEEWLTLRRRRLREQAVAAGRRWARHLEEEGDGAAAIRTLRRVLALSPFDQDALRALMSLHVERGDHGQAVLAYEGFARRLQAELGLPPSDETRSLLERARNASAEGPPRGGAPVSGAEGAADGIEGGEGGPEGAPAVSPSGASAGPELAGGEATLREPPAVESSAGGAPSGSAALNGPTVSPTRAARPRRWSLAAALVVVVAGAWAVLANGGGRDAPVRIAIAPLESLGPPDSAYFAAGLTDELVTRLAAVPGLEVVSGVDRSGRLRDADPLELAREFEARFAVTGRVRWDPSDGAADRVRVTARVLRADDGTEVWTQTYQAVLADIFTVQDRIARAVTEAVGVSLLGGAETSEPPTRDQEAFLFYLRGWDFHHEEWTAGPLSLAAEMFRQAVTLDPRFADAWAGLSLSLSELYMGGWETTPEVRADAVEAGERAMVLDPESAWSQLAMAMVHYRLRLDYAAADTHLRRAEELRPGDPEILLAGAYVSRRKGDWDEAIRRFQGVLERQPGVSRGRGGLAWTLIHLRRYQEADALMAQTLEVFPDVRGFYGTAAMTRIIGSGDVGGARRLLEEGAARLAGGRTGEDWFDVAFLERRFDDALAALPREGAHLDRAAVHLARGDSVAARASFDSARVELEARSAEGFLDEATTLSQLGLAYAGLGRIPEARERVERAAELLPASRDALEAPRIQVTRARVHAEAGDPDRAVELLRGVLQGPAELSVHLLRLDPRFDLLREHPGFQRLLAEE